MSRSNYDFIVVGSGPAGACVASRLASSKSSPAVLLVEAGVAKDSANANILAERWTAARQFPNSVERFQTEPQEWLHQRRVDYSRGKVLGGSSAVNMCAYTVGPRDDYDRWARMVGDAAFSWDNAVRIRKEKLEAFDGTIAENHRRYAAPDMSVHGEHGALALSIPEEWESPIIAQLDAARESGLGLNVDINSGNPLGMASAPSTAKSGRRITAVDAYLENAPPNLTILAETQVVRVLLVGKRAVGIHVAGGKEYHASKEVILSAGAVDTPKLLMLSGIGNTSELAEHGIETLHHLPGVGKNLQDHLSVPLCWKLKDSDVGWAQHFSDPDAVKKAPEQFRENGTGPLRTFFQGLTMGFFKADEDVLHTTEFGSLQQDVQEHLKRETVPIWELSCHIPPCTPAALAAPEAPYLTIFVFLHNSPSRGTVSLASASPCTPPLINPNFLSHPFDRLCAIAAIKRTLAFIRHPSALASNILCVMDGPASEHPEDVLEYWGKNGGSTWHPAGTVKMGRGSSDDDDDDQESCVGPNFAVRGLQGLRVVDLSVLPFLLSCHPVSVAYLVGELAAESIGREYGLDV